MGIDDTAPGEDQGQSQERGIPPWEGVHGPVDGAGEPFRVVMDAGVPVAVGLDADKDVPVRAGGRPASDIAAPAGTSSRRLARIIAVQALYEIDAVGADAGVSVAALADEHQAQGSSREFAAELVRGAVEHMPAIDAVIGQTAPQWPLPQVAAVDRAILRLAVFELRYTRDTPSKVAINEAVELAKEYGSESSGRFVNGVLGHVLTLDAPTPRGGAGRG